MNNIYHQDIYQFNTPVSSYWEDTSSENLQIDKLKKDTNSEIVVIGGGYTGLLCAINLIENHNLDVILVEAGKIGWGASSRNAGFNCLPPSKMSFKKMQSIYGVEETKKFFRNSVEGSNHTKDIIKEYNIDTAKTDSILLYTPEVGISSKSMAALKIAFQLGFPNNLLCVFFIIPPFVRNYVYDYIAKNRYKWYGKKESCMIPTPELKSKFLG